MIGGEMEIEICEVPQQQIYDGVSFPLVLNNGTSASDLTRTTSWITENERELSRHLSVHGAILFRGFPLASDIDFDAFVSAFDYPNFTYQESLSNAVRVNRTERVFTANEAPSEVNIYLHHEMAQTPIYPSKLFFFCEQAAEQGGATPLCRSDILLDRMREQCGQFVNDCLEKGLQYTNTMPDDDDAQSGMGRSWRSTLRADNREAAEQRLAKLNYSWEWLDDGCLRATTPVLSAIREISPGRAVFFNQLIAATRGWKDNRNDPSKSITHGDGSQLDSHGVSTTIEISAELSFDLNWQTGDVALVDNYITMHGRRNFSGTRKVLASLVAS